MSGASSDNIWDAAIALDQQRRLQGAGTAGAAGGDASRDRETSLLVLGSKNSGETRTSHKIFEGR